MAENDEENMCIEPGLFVDVVISSIYRQVFTKHISTQDDDYCVVYENLMSSKLSDKTKTEIFTRDQLVCTIKNITWVVQYWKTVNENPEIDTEGKHGFILEDSKLKYTN
jgi:hypothetical protein